MKRRFLLLLPVLLAACEKPPEASAGSTPAAPAAEFRLGERLPQSGAPAPATAEFREVTWDALMPKDWDPAKLMQGLDFGQLQDSDPRAMEALEQMRKAWDSAPAEPSMNGARIRIPGFIVPLDAQKGEMKEFLLVPYFGACVHTPPPPANQIIHASAARPLKNIQMMEAVWVSGTMETARSNTDFGASGYRMKAEIVTPYKP